MDQATAFLLADAHAQGMSSRQYAKEFGLVLLSERHKIAENERRTAEPHDVLPHCRQCAPAKHECE